MEIKRLVWIDVLNIIACAGVLLLHCTNDQVHGFSGTPSADWFIGLTTHSFFLWPVNVFFMISGFTLTSHLALTDYNNWGGGGGETVLQQANEAAGHTAVGMERGVYAPVFCQMPY